MAAKQLSMGYTGQGQAVCVHVTLHQLLSAPQVGQQRQTACSAAEAIGVAVAVVPCCRNSNGNGSRSSSRVTTNPPAAQPLWALPPLEQDPPLLAPKMTVTQRGLGGYRKCSSMAVRRSTRAGAGTLGPQYYAAVFGTARPQQQQAEGRARQLGCDSATSSYNSSIATASEQAWGCNIMPHMQPPRRTTEAAALLCVAAAAAVCRSAAARNPLCQRRAGSAVGGKGPDTPTTPHSAETLAGVRPLLRQTVEPFCVAMFTSM